MHTLLLHFAEVLELQLQVTVGTIVKRLVKKPTVRQNPENGVCKSYACLSVYHSSILSTVTVDLFDPRIEDTTNTKDMLHNTADRIV